MNVENLQDYIDAVIEYLEDDTLAFKLTENRIIERKEDITFINANVGYIVVSKLNYEIIECKLNDVDTDDILCKDNYLNGLNENREIQDLDKLFML